MAPDIKYYVSTLSFKTVEKAIDYCVEKNINLELSKFAIPYLADKAESEIGDIKALLQKTGKTDLTFHGACYALCPATIDDRILEVTDYRLKQSVGIARKVGAKCVVFHSGYNSLVKSENYINNFIEKQIEFWKQFIEDNKIDDIIIALENTEENDPQILKRIYEGVSSPYFKSCIDIGHIAAFSNYNLIHWMSELEEYLYHFHIHNNNSSRDQHLSIFKGEINFDEFLSYLCASSKSLNLVLEMFDVEDVTESLEYLRKKFP